MRRMSGCLRLLVSAWLCAGAVRVFAAGPPSGIDVVWAYAGTWKIETENFDTAHSKAGKEHATLRNACWKDGGYLACNQYVDGDSKVLLVFTYNASDKTYTSYPIPQGGGAAGKGTLLISGNVWTFPWEQTEGGVTTYYRVVNTFTSAQRIESRKEFSTDKEHWTVMAKGFDVKVAEP